MSAAATGDPQPVETQRQRSQSSAVQGLGEKSRPRRWQLPTLGFRCSEMADSLPRCQRRRPSSHHDERHRRSGLSAVFPRRRAREALREATEKLGRAGCALVSRYFYQLMADTKLSGAPTANPGGRFRAIVRDVASDARSPECSIGELADQRLTRAGNSMAPPSNRVVQVDNIASIPHLAVRR
jgi:hypothetical protein